MLTVEERRLIFQYCWEHPVASCVPCHAEYRLPELGADVFRGLSHLCPRCRADLSASAREHVASCTALRVQEAEARERAQSTAPPESTLLDQQDSIRRLIQRKLDDGRLQRNCIPHVWGGAGNGEACDGCDETITRKQLLMGAIGAAKKGFQLHVRCFSVWDDLRRTRRVTRVT